MSPRKRAVGAINETARKPQSIPAYRIAFSFISEPIFVGSGETGMVVDANAAAEALIGRSLSEIRALHESKLHPSELSEAARQTFAERVRRHRSLVKLA